MLDHTREKNLEINTRLENLITQFHKEKETWKRIKQLRVHGQINILFNVTQPNIQW